MMNNFVVALSIFALLQMVASRPSGNSGASGDFTKDSRVDLPGSEKISKRSIEEFQAAIDFHPLPVFGKRSVNKREIPESSIQGTYKRFLRSLNNNEESDDDMKVAENGMVFLPMFRPKTGVVRNQRSRRSLQDVAKPEILPNGVNTDDLEGAETIIFRPVFRSQLRPVRSIEKEDLEGDDMIVAENGLIFRPLFKTKQRGPGSF